MKKERKILFLIYLGVVVFAFMMSNRMSNLENYEEIINTNQAISLSMK